MGSRSHEAAGAVKQRKRAEHLFTAAKDKAQTNWAAVTIMVKHWGRKPWIHTAS